MYKEEEKTFKYLERWKDLEISKMCKKNVNFSEKSEVSDEWRDIPCSQMGKLNKAN